MSEREAWQVTDDAAVLYEQSFVPAIFAHAAPMVADAAAIRPGDHVVDVGCGTGALTREATKRVGANGHVVGLDLNPRMLAVARRLAPEVEWREGDAAQLPFADASFDAAVSQFMLMFTPDPVAALREIWRVLAPGGRLAVAVCGPLSQARGYAALAAVAERVCEAEVVNLLRSPFALGHRARIAELAGAAGLVGAQIDTHECPVRFPSIDALVHTEVRASPIRDVIDEHSFQTLLEGARAELARWCERGREVAFPMPMHIVTARKAS